MTLFEFETPTDLPQLAYVRIDNRFDVAITRTEHGINFSVYPITGGIPWMDPLDSFTVYEADIVAAEREMEDEI